MNNQPAILYKYYPPERIDFFDKHLVRFTPTSEFNDPFEFKPANSLPERIDLPTRLKTNLLQPEEHLHIYEVSNGSNQPLKLREVVRYRYSSGKEYDTYYDGIAGILCLSEQTDNILMWSHYSNCHRGFVIGFHTENSFFNPPNNNGAPIRSLKKVNYRIKRDQTFDKKFMYEFLYIKAKDWDYEKEWRMVLNLENFEETNGLMEVPISAISSVIVGINSDENLREKAKNFCYNNQIKFMIAKRKSDSYAIDIHGDQITSL